MYEYTYRHLYTAIRRGKKQRGTRCGSVPSLQQREQTRRLVALGGIAFAGRTMILAEFEQGRLLACAAERNRKPA